MTALNKIEEFPDLDKLINEWKEEAQKQEGVPFPTTQGMKTLYCKATKMKNDIELEKKKNSEQLKKELARINDDSKFYIEKLDEVREFALEEVKQILVQMENLRNEGGICISQEMEYGRGDAIIVTKNSKSWKIEDASKIPSRYLMVDEKKIEQDIKLGVFEIPGIEIYDTTAISLRIR